MSSAELGPIDIRRRSVARAPSHLREPGRSLWKAILSEFELTSSAQLTQLLIAAEQQDLLEDCRAQLDEDGRFILNRFGQTIAHPAIEVQERASRLQLAALRALELDVHDALKRYAR